MKTLAYLGRILFAVPFIVMGIMHFINASDMAASMLSGWPVAEGIIYVTGFAMFLAGVSIVVKIQAKIACLILALLLLLIIIFIHIPVVTGGDQAAMSNLLRDLGLMGASLTYANLLSK
jgi:putative oxidoreductase